MLAVKADVNKADDLGQTPLIQASYCGRVEIVKLLTAGAETDKIDTGGNTALTYATR